MRHTLFVFFSILLTLSCTKEETGSKQPEQTSANEIEALKKEVKELREMVGLLAPANEFETFKKENEELKVQVELLTSDFFEVDGLRFDKNGTLISIPKLESEVVEDAGYLMGSIITLTTTRSYDAEGRVIEIYRNYNTHSEWASIPYYWQKVLYEYDGKTCKTTTQTARKNMAAGVPYEEEITETSFW